MAFQGPKQDSDFESDDGGGVEAGLFAEINITPLTDIILVLLIIFMVTSSAMVDAARDGRLDITLPSATSAATAPSEQKDLVVGITADGRLFVHGEVIEEDALKTLLDETKKTDPNTMIVVQADGDLQHKKVVAVIDMLRNSGFASVGIETAESGQ